MNARLKALAYSMLGNADDAQEIVQEAHLRLHQQTTPPDSEEAFLYRVTSNLCLDKLRQEKQRRKAYFGPWLPEPVVLNQEQQLEMAQQLTMGFLVLMDSLTPSERIAYVLREAFDYSFAEIATILDVSEANARQRASRARKRLQGDTAIPPLPDHEERQLLETLTQHVMAGDVNELVKMMSDDFVGLTDGGGVVSAAIRPVIGAQRFSTVLAHLAKKLLAAQANGEQAEAMTVKIERLNSSSAIVIRLGNAIHSCTFIEMEPPGADKASASSARKIRRVYIVRNPQKLRLLNLT